MKVFLSSTTYDLVDVRAKVIEILTKHGHEVIFHESPTFPAKIDLHSHDQCILAVEQCDTIVCILDKRFGGSYSGDILNNTAPLKFSISGKDEKGERLKVQIELPKNKLSITWCELLRGYQLNKNIITFARQRTLDEKETRRHNQYLKTFRPAYAEKNELFDLIDWITKQRRNNWITPFNTVVDLEEKLTVYVNEYDKLRLKTTISKKHLEKKICIIVEGEIDRVVVQQLIRKSKIKGDFVIIPAYGKYRILQNLNDYTLPFADSFDQVIILIDTDAKNHEQFSSIQENIATLSEQLVRKNVAIFYANPSIEAWITSGIDEKSYRELEGLVDKEKYSTIFEPPTIENVRYRMRRFNIAQAMQLAGDLADFIGTLRQYAYFEEMTT